LTLKYYCNKYANDGLIRLNKFVSQFSDELCN